MNEGLKKNAEVFEDTGIDRTLHAQEGACLYVRVMWNDAAASLIQLDSTAADMALLLQANERGLDLVIPLPVPAILESAWLAFCEELGPLLERGREEWRPVMAGSGSYFRGILSPAGQEIQRALIERIATIEPGDGVLMPIEPARYLRELALWDRERFVYTVPGLGEIGPQPNYPKLLELAEQLDDHARERGCVLTDDGHYDLVALAEHACCEYTDPNNYSAEIQAEAAAIDQELELATLKAA